MARSMRLRPNSWAPAPTYSQAKLGLARGLIGRATDVCGGRVENVEDPLMQKIRYLDKLIDDLARGKPMDKVLRTAPASS